MHGANRYNYFPIVLSHAVIASVLFGEGNIRSSFLLESFLQYVIPAARETILITHGVINFILMIVISSIS